MVDDPEWPGHAPVDDPFDLASLEAFLQADRSDWKRWFHVAFRYDALCDPENAAQRYERAIEIEPRNGLVRYLLGRARLSAGTKTKAEKDLFLATRLRPDLRVAWALLGALRLEAGKVAEALSAYREALRIEPSGETYWQIGRCFIELNRPREATVALEEAVRLHPRHTLAHATLVSLGDVVDDPEMTRRHLRRLFELDEEMARRIVAERRG